MRTAPTIHSIRRDSEGKRSMSRIRPWLLALGVACAATLALCAATAHAANYKMLLCAGYNGSNSFQTATNTTSPQNPGGIFDFSNYCGPAPDPAEGAAFLRIAENQSGGTAGESAYGSISWTVPPWVSILAASGYTREPYNFADGWRGRFWGEDFGGGGHHILMQGTGVPSQEFFAPTSSSFTPHAWPFPNYGSYRRFIFELTCMRPAGCDRGGLNVVDANTIMLTLGDAEDEKVALTGDTPLMAGRWVRGGQGVTWNAWDHGSGVRVERLRTDGALRDTVTHPCDIGSTPVSGEFARVFEPCPNGGPFGSSYGLDTASLPDGVHTLEVCGQDYAQAFSGAPESCDRRTIRTDNSPPAKPASLEVTSSNPNRYLSRFGARFSLAPDPGSPIVKVHYFVTDDNEGGKAVEPERVVSATNPSAISGIEGPAKPGTYTLHVALEDEVGYLGSWASAPIPHDTVPPAAPQELHVVGSTTHWREKLDLRWRNIVDAGSPIDVAGYQLLDTSGNAIGGVRGLSADNVQAIDGIEAPAQRCVCSVRVWLADEEGNVGAAASVSLPIDTTPPAAPQGLQVAAPDTPRSAEGFDLRWSDLGDEGSPIAAAHYEVLDGAGKVAVPTQTVTGEGISSIADIQAPDSGGDYALKLWLSDEEGNAGAPATVPLSYECGRSPVGGGAHLDASLSDATVRQGQGSNLKGALREGSGAPVAGASLCVFEQVEGDPHRRYIGLAYTDAAGNYGFGVTPGPNRTLRAVYRPGNRRLVAQAQLRTRVKPTLRARKSVIHNGQVAHLEGQIPGPRNDDVVIVIQVRQGKGWLAFRRYRTRGGGRYEAAYPFHRTIRPTTYEFRAQVRESGGYPYLEGDSDPIALKVLPKAKRQRCPKGRHLAKRHGKARCALPRASAAKRCAKARRALHRRPTEKVLRRRAHRLCAQAQHRRRHARHGHRRAG